MDNANQPHSAPAAQREKPAVEGSGFGRIARAARTSWPIAVIAGVFAALSIFYGFATPLFEGIDEGYHFNIINYIANHHALPDLNSRYIGEMASSRAIVMELGDPDAISHEATQPPLYYMASAVLVSGVNRSDFQSVFRTNFDFVNGIANFHPPAESVFPPANTYLAMRIIRLFSTLLGALTVLFTYGAAKQLFHRADVAALAAALTAFNPKFIHLSSVVTNDIAVACAATLTLWVAVRMATSRYPGMRPFIRHAFALGACVGLTALTKYSGLAMLAPAGLAILWVAIKQRRTQSALRLTVIGSAALGAGFLLVGGWLFAHNWLSYGNPLAWDQVQAANAFTRRPAALTPGQVIGTIPALLQTYWGYFGNGVQFPPSVDIANTALLIVAAIGVVIALRRRLIPAEIAILLVAALGVIATFIEWMRLYTVTENSRLLAPMFVTTSALISVGLLAWLPRRWWPRASGLITAGCIVWAGLTPWAALLPSYGAPPYLTPAQAQALPGSGRVSYANGIELVSASLQTNRVDSGGAVDLTLYWRATRPLTVTYDLVLQAIGPDGASLGRVTTAQFIGRQFVAADWQLDQVAAINYRLPISAAHQTVAAIYAGWYEHRPGRRSRAATP
ncbi:MAG: phospholipid carrier-dependent glycosyltransferase [Chloroflexi bacterium]|nr:phospholipid carrier-dependent glycosyltransferase [Chloroflexota bacterium]